MSSLSDFRWQFPVLRGWSYLNAGTEGPVPVAATEAVRELLEADSVSGRVGKPRFERVMALAAQAREAYAGILGAAPEEVALTSSTTGGINAVLGALRWQRGDEVLTSDQEHPGLLAPLRRLAVVHGVSVKVAPFASVAQGVGPQTKLIACSHVSWVGGEVADVPALVATGVPVLLDAAQALGAIPLDLPALGVDFYAGSGQKWLCGPEGSGALYVRGDRLQDLEPPAPGYSTVTDHDDVLGSPLEPSAARFDEGFPSPYRSLWALKSIETLAGAGWEQLHARAADQAAWLAEELTARGLHVAPRGRSPLVSWRPRDADADAEVARLAQDRVIVRSIPSAGLVRASVGGWTAPEELEALVQLVA